ncbi:MAG: hypothetical protein J0M10_04605 [Chitinophagales bacterium]|nr:hypothetical protein [Chitinophagales bacterium]
MKQINKIVLALLVIMVLASCTRNYYSGAGKGSRGGKGCGCPSTRI